MCAMAYAEFQQELKKAQLTAREFARLIQMNESSITNYSSKGTVPSHLAVIATLIGALAAHEIDFRHVIGKTAIEPKRPRGGGVFPAAGRAESGTKKRDAS
ncbi:XRE family transcriptional regulator [Burkholderia vietnamiensis]|uniref:XRE family transcriptional regulator n=1 Tax=Burkholderia vietnamiensis TaxID=60552 RepID=UPI0026512524|nr:XRE family transcriptional regulator [Burkholderia vietnamiensis]MDN7554808.1 XRE family transcriptional regulator [Burkholderia vietnamiensis]HDR9092726.1 XRE family transcriptional regulator [Burkholderia vietnamiensis]